MSDTPTGRIRRLRGRRVDATVALAVLIPLITVVALLLARPQGWSVPVTAPSTLRVNQSTLVCPAAMPGNDTVSTVSAAGDGTASVTPIGRSQSQSASLRSGTPTTLRASSGAVQISATGAPAGGLVAGRWSTSPLSATDCPATGGDQWFVGLGAGPVHDSVLEVTNPSDGESVVDVDVMTERGPVDVPALRGIAVGPHSTRSFDLLDVAPQRGTLALHAKVTRGQVAMSVRDQARGLTGGAAHEDWLAPQAVPKNSNLLLGIQPGQGTHTVSIANPTGRQLTASIQLVTRDSVFTPSGAPTVDVGPKSVATLSLDKLLGEKVAADTVGVQVSAGGPIAVSMRRVASNDVLTSTAASHIHQATTALVPPGSKQLILAGATGVGAVTVVSRDAHGNRLGSQRVAVEPRQAATVHLPGKAVSVEVTPENVDIAGSILINGDGATTVPLRDLVRNGQIPAVRPGLR